MQQFLQATAYGLLQGGLYALVAIGFSLVWGVMHIVNVAHGALVILGAYVAWRLSSAFGFEPLLGMVVAAVVLFAGGYVLQRGLINLVVNAPIWMTLLLTFGLALLIQNGLVIVYSGDFRSIPTSYAGSAFTLSGVRVPYGRLIGLGLALLFTFLLAAFIDRTRTGRAIKATGMERSTARLMGIDVRHTYALTFAISAALAGAAGALIGLVGTFNPASAGSLTLRSFVIAVLGGLGNIWGSLAGGLVLGLVEAWGSQYLSGTLVNAIAFGVLVVVLILRPSGLLGRPFYEARQQA
jgi:branched-chain amino acid transport system permease protein